MPKKDHNLELNGASSGSPDPYAAKYKMLGSEKLIGQLRQHEQLPKGTVYGVEVPGLPHPIHLRAGTSDLWVFDQIFLYQELAIDLGPDVGFIVDAGANIGLASIHLAHRFPEAHILALEVEQHNFELLLANARPYPNIRPLWKGLWKRRASLVIDNPQDEAWAFTVSEADLQAHSGIEGVSVADLLHDFSWARIDLLKMDIEGAESEVLSSGTEGWLDSVRVLAIEVHYDRPGCWEAFSRIAEQHPFTCKWSGEYAVLTRTAPREEPKQP